MTKRFVTHKGNKITAESNPWKQGGEGAIYRLAGNGAEHRVAKIWHTREKADRAFGKIQWMVDNPPPALTDKVVSSTIIWPRDLLFEKKRFVGFTMPTVNDSVKLFSFVQPSFPGTKWGREWQKFELYGVLKNRLVVCYNLAQALRLLHMTERIVVLDMKPENILVHLNGHISLIDLDSAQVADDRRVFFPGTAYTPEYAPPEFHNNRINPLTCKVPIQHDLFSLAVILYQILVGVHPFQASHSVNTTLTENIAQGLFVFGPRRKELHRIPELHDNFTTIPEPVKELFVNTFMKGYKVPAHRATAAEWADTLLSALKDEKSAIPRKKKPQVAKSNVKKVKVTQSSNIVNVIGNNMIVNSEISINNGIGTNNTIVQIRNYYTVNTVSTSKK